MRDTIQRLTARKLIEEGDRNKGKIFAALFEEHLKEQYSFGSDVEPTSATQSFYYQLFRSYVDHRNLHGVVLLGPANEGVLMWGAPASPMAYRWGKTAIAWGTYLRPEYRDQGFEELMEEIALEKLRAQGFEAVMTSVPVSQEPPAGFEAVMTTSVLAIKDPESNG